MTPCYESELFVFSMLFLGASTLFAIGVALLLLRGPKFNKSFKRFPPSPLADPLIGHVRMIPSESPWIKFAEWTKAYGDVIYLHVFGQPMIILGGVESTRELMGGRGANYSDRPRMVMHGEL